MGYEGGGHFNFNLKNELTPGFEFNGNLSAIGVNVATDMDYSARVNYKSELGA